MSWNINTGIVRKAEAPRVIEALQLTGEHEPYALDQFEEAKDVAILLLRSIPGPYVTVNMTGHANGVGYQGKGGWSNDFVNVSVCQQTQEDKDRVDKPLAVSSSTLNVNLENVTIT
jgi:hypothetical protein